jgi:hypothetical protein
VRTTLSGDDTSYNCVMEMEDSLGNRGVKLSKELMKIAGTLAEWLGESRSLLGLAAAAWATGASS